MWNKIKPYDESSLPPVGKRVLVLSDEGMPFISEREEGALEVYCGKYDDKGYAVWWIYLPNE